MANMPPMNSIPILLKQIWLRLSTMSLAVILLVVLSVASVIGTVLLQNQDQQDYLQQFGPLWYWVFRSLGLFDMYHTWWFLTLLGFLMLSLMACLWRNVPLMLKEMRQRKVVPNKRAMARMELNQSWQLPDADADKLKSTFTKALHGWETRTESVGDKHYIRADKGRYHKWGYILTHTAILLILIGGMISVQFGFRGDMAVAEGSQEKTIRFLKGTETATLDMPFDVRCNSFVIDFYPTGMPKEFRSNLTIIDDGKEVMTSDIIVNEPLFYKGVYIYQASFGDGGSGIGFDLYQLDGSEKIEKASTHVYETWSDPASGISLEVTNFRPHNVENMSSDPMRKDFKDIGPSVEFIMRGPGLKPVKVKSFMEPFIDADGNNQGSWVQISMSGDAKDFKSLALGLDLTDPKEWALYHAFLRRMNDIPQGERTKKSNLEAFKLAVEDVYGSDTPENLREIGLRVIQAVQLVPQLPWPVIPMLGDFDHLYYTGLQLARDPGMNVVWTGSAILVIGLCIMFYMPHRKLWLEIDGEAEETRITLAGLTNRNQMAYKATFNELFTKLDEEFRHHKL